MFGCHKFIIYKWKLGKKLCILKSIAIKWLLISDNLFAGAP